MRKLIGLMGFVGLILVSGCGTLGNGRIDNPLLGSPYQAGRTFVFVDVVTEPVQPDEVRDVIDQVYALVQVNLDGYLIDDVIKAQIDEFYKESSPEFREVLFNTYKALSVRLLDQINRNPKLSKFEVWAEFQRGVNDALALYKPVEK